MAKDYKGNDKNDFFTTKEDLGYLLGTFGKYGSLILGISSIGTNKEDIIGVFTAGFLYSCFEYTRRVLLESARERNLKKTLDSLIVKKGENIQSEESLVLGVTGGDDD